MEREKDSGDVLITALAGTDALALAAEDDEALQLLQMKYVDLPRFRTGRNYRSCRRVVEKRSNVLQVQRRFCAPIKRPLWVVNRSPQSARYGRSQHCFGDRYR